MPAVSIRPARRDVQSVYALDGSGPQIDVAVDLDAVDLDAVTARGSSNRSQVPGRSQHAEVNGIP
jgi:hypothetical protein